MKQPPALSRRRLLVYATQLPIATSGLLALSACDSITTSRCFTADTMSKGEVFARTSRGYVEASTEAQQNCQNCDLFSSNGGDCGKCTIDNLPANPQGYCTSWSAPV